jgi:hypothetical protein
MNIIIKAFNEKGMACLTKIEELCGSTDWKKAYHENRNKPTTYRGKAMIRAMKAANHIPFKVKRLSFDTLSTYQFKIVGNIFLDDIPVNSYDSQTKNQIKNAVWTFIHECEGSTDDLEVSCE